MHVGAPLQLYGPKHCLDSPPPCPPPPPTQVHVPTAPQPGDPIVTPSVLDGPGTITLEAGEYVCELPTCILSWRITCGADGPNFTRNGAETQLTVGIGPSFNLDMLALARRGGQMFSCNAALLVKDAAGQVTSRNTTFQVGAGGGHARASWCGDVEWNTAASLMGLGAPRGR